MTLIEPYFQDELCAIYLGDSRDLLPALSADVMVTDPPYGIQHTGGGFNGGRRGLSITNDGDTSVRDAVLDAWGGERPALVFGSPMQAPPTGHKQVLCWDKGNAAGVIGSTRGWRNSWEAIYVLGDWPKRPALWRRVIAYAADMQGSKESGHPHTKPVPLLSDLIQKCPEGTIIDPFMGSGTTLRAAKDLGRKCIGIEIDPKWCEVAVKRLAQENLFA